MEYFLERIARSIKSEFGNTLNLHCLVFPNRRAGLYFMKHLSSGIEKPVWVPSILTINELFRSYSFLQLAGNEILLFELYKAYRKIKKSPESFDDFYFWGDMLINDFDDTDKYLVDASALFTNVRDIKKIDQQFGSLTEEQKLIIRRFWVNFDIEKPTDQKLEFSTTWSVLYELYEAFRNSLKERNVAYEGMIFRETAELENEKLISATSWDTVHFIGFNALNECEKRLMSALKKAGKARFYWDFDNSYINPGHYNSAGFFMRDNIKLFGNDMPSDWNYNTMLSVPSPAATRRVIETSSDVAQVKLLPRLISSVPGLNPENAHHTAVVLADENLLMPVLTSLPENTGDINITMGYPLRQSLVYTLVKHLMELQRTAVNFNGVIHFHSANVLDILGHSLIENLLTETDKSLSGDIIKNNLSLIASEKFSGSETLSLVFKKLPDPASLSTYFKDILSLIALNSEIENDTTDSVQRNIRNEYIYRIVLSINRLESIINDPEILFTTDIYMRILERMLRIQSVPFSGEPLSGIQIMGILETRALDFKNLIILSVNEGVLPAVSSASSFIPFSLREAFGLPSVNHQESIYAYHFYRLLQRSENVTFAYNSNSEGLRSGEMSRFLIQMNYDKILKPEFLDLSFEIRSHNTINEIVERTEDHSARLNAMFGSGKMLSPSAINTWLGCRMKFFYRYVNGLKEPEKISGEIDPAIFGNILHEIMRSLYQDYTGKIMSRDMLDTILGDDEQLRKTVTQAISKKFRRSEDGFERGNEQIIKDILLVFTKRILQADRSMSPITILRLENKLGFDLPINGNMISIGGIADRVDVVEGTTRIVDYKTGNVSDKISSISELFTDDRKKDHDGWLQTLIYCEAYISASGDTPLRPSIYKIRKMTGGTISDKLRMKPDRTSEEFALNDYRDVREAAVNELTEVLLKIFNKDEPFTMTKEIRAKCSYCPYKGLCLR